MKDGRGGDAGQAGGGVGGELGLNTFTLLRCQAADAAANLLIPTWTADNSPSVDLGVSSSGSWGGFCICVEPPWSGLSGSRSRVCWFSSQIPPSPPRCPRRSSACGLAVSPPHIRPMRRPPASKVGTEPVSGM